MDEETKFLEQKVVHHDTATDTKQADQESKKQSEQESKKQPEEAQTFKATNRESKIKEKELVEVSETKQSAAAIIESSKSKVVSPTQPEEAAQKVEGRKIEGFLTPAAPPCNRLVKEKVAR